MAMHFDTTTSNANEKNQSSNNENHSSQPGGKEGMEIVADPNLGNSVRQEIASETALNEQGSHLPHASFLSQSVKAPFFNHSNNYTFESTSVRELSAEAIDCSLRNIEVINNWANELCRCVPHRSSNNDHSKENVFQRYIRAIEFPEALRKLSDILAEAMSGAGNDSGFLFFNNKMPNVIFIRTARDESFSLNVNLVDFIVEATSVLGNNEMLQNCMYLASEWVNANKNLAMAIAAVKSDDGSVLLLLPSFEELLKIDLINDHVSNY